MTHPQPPLDPNAPPVSSPLRQVEPAAAIVAVDRGGPLNRGDESESAAWDWLDDRYLDVDRGCDPHDRDYGVDEMIDAFLAGLTARTS